MPHGTMPEKCDRSGATLIEKPCSVTQRFTRIADRADLGFVGAAAGPDADPPGLAPRLDAEVGERGDHPAFEAMDEAANVAPALLEVEHEVADPLAGAVIGVAPAAPGLVHRESAAG